MTPRPADDRASASPAAVPATPEPAAARNSPRALKVAGQSVEQLRQAWLQELLTREIEARGAEGTLRAIGLDLADVWRRDLMSPFTFEFLESHSLAELLDMAEELGIPIDPSRSKANVVRAMLASKALREKLPVELAWRN